MATLNILEKDGGKRRGRIRRRSSITESAGSTSKKIATSSAFPHGRNKDWPTALRNTIDTVSLRTGHNAVVIGLNGSEIANGPSSPNYVRQLVNDTLWSLSRIETLSLSTLIVWRSFSWCSSCEWKITFADEDSRSNNYLVYVANQQAEMTILEMQRRGAVAVFYMDWSREVLHCSLEDDRLTTGFTEELSVLLLQMLAKEVSSNHIISNMAVDFAQDMTRNELLTTDGNTRRLGQHDAITKVKLARNIDFMNNSTFPSYENPPVSSNEVMTQMSINFLTIHFLETLLVLFIFLSRKCKR